MPALEATTDYSSPQDDSFRPKPAVVEGTRPRIANETQALLRARLRAAMLMMLVAFALFFIRDRFLPETTLELTIFQISMLGLLGSTLALLSGRRPFSLAQLRFIEVSVFGLIALFMAMEEYTTILRYARRDDATLALATLKHGVLDIVSLIAMYGIFIPNNWRRAAMVVVPLALTPPLVMALLRTFHPELRPVAERVISFEQVSDNVLVLVLGAGTSIFGSHVINTLRTEAFEARQLGQYRLGEKIGAGGMGEVYFAEHRLLKRPCAIKLIRPGRDTDPRALARFEREVRATAHLSHWNTVEIFDYGRTEDGTFYYVMEYLPGLSLAEIVERFGPLPPERAIHLLVQACQALREAHGAGLIHRDLKPANLFAAHRGGLDDVTKILDFGLVLPTSDPASPQLSHEGAITGSPLYMSPEQATGDRRADRRSDLYSLGAVTYHLLTGRPPFEGDSAIGVMIAHARDPVVPPSQIRPGLPEDLERVVLRCLAKDPDDRYQDAEALERDLSACRDAGKWTQARASQWWSVLRTPRPGPAPSLQPTAEFTT